MSENAPYAFHLGHHTSLALAAFSTSCYDSDSTIPSFDGVTMAQRCEMCGKGPSYGNVISHANNTRRRRWNPNLRRVHALVQGVRKQVRVCTACIRAGKVQKVA